MGHLPPTKARPWFLLQAERTRTQAFCLNNLTREHTSSEGSNFCRCLQNLNPFPPPGGCTLQVASAPWQQSSISNCLLCVHRDAEAATSWFVHSVSSSTAWRRGEGQ